MSTFAFVGTELGRVENRSRDYDNVLVTFAVDEWLSHSDGPSEFQVRTAQGEAACGVGQARGLVGVFVYGDIGEAAIYSCGSIQQPGETVTAFEGRVAAKFPVAFTDPPPGGGDGGGSYLDLVLPAAMGSLALGAIGLMVLSSRRKRTNAIE